MSIEELQTAVRELQDRQAIRDCLMAYCRGVDRLDRDLLISAYHPDAIDDHSVFVGDRNAFADWAIALHARNQYATQHIITNHSCDIEGDAAHCETYWMFAAMNKEGAALSLRGGRYIDRFDRRDGRWAIAARKCVVDWHGRPDEPQFTGAVRQAFNSCGQPARDRSDPSYERPLAIDRGRIGIRIMADVEESEL